MNLLQPHGCSLTEGEEKALDPPLDPATSSMRGEGATPTSQVPAALAAHEDARALVRLVQCRQCSTPYRTPVTLPCGHSLCRSCLPQSHARANITYPNTPDRQHGIRCPIETCRADHPAPDCSVDVTLLKVMESLHDEVSKHISGGDGSPMLVEELAPHPDGLEKQTTAAAVEPRSWTLRGGRLLATFTLAEMGELPFKNDISYRSLSEDGDSEEQLDIALLNRLREATYKELDCHVCYNMMYDPVTTGCGHTFCRKCLARVLDHSNHCPVCRRTLRIPPSLDRQASNACLKALLNGLCPEMVAARAEAVAREEHFQDAETEMPIFVCTLAFPGMPTFLHIFEPQYRLMIRRAMEGNRRFGMVLYNRSGRAQGNLGVTPFLQYGTVLEIVNIEYMLDGRSYVETRGVSRFRIRSHGVLDGYMVGNVERIEDISLSDEEQLEAVETSAAVASLSAIQAQQVSDLNASFNAQLDRLSTSELLLKGVTFVERMRALSADWLSQRIVAAYGGPPEDPALFPYWFACVLPIAEEEKYFLLRTTSVRERLKIVNRWIRRIESQRWWVFLNSLPCLPSSPPPPFPPAYR
jgi:Lon protease-like protein